MMYPSLNPRHEKPGKVRLCRRLDYDMYNATMIDSGPVTCVGELIKILCTRIGKDNRVLWYRGHRCATWRVSSTIWRDYNGEAERNFTNRFRARAPTRYQNLPRYDDCGLWLSLMQHYRLPTRLLDWTRSPLIAAYFALEDYIYKRSVEPQDAAIWVLEPHILNELGEFGSVTPSIDADMCSDTLRPAFTDAAKENNKVLAAMASERDIRMFVQQGCFTIHSDRIPLDEKVGGQKYLSRITIPRQSVKEMAVEIDVCGFRKGDIFPDLENLANELKSSAGFKT